MASPYQKGPRKINPVSVLIVAGLVFAVYASVRFLPPYWTSWQVKEKLRDACAAMYQMRNYDASIKTAELQKLQDKVLGDIKQLGVEDPEASVELDDSDPAWAIARADYRVTVTHPMGKPTVMHFTPEAKLDMTPSDLNTAKHK
jgi:hypothetical protein